MKLRSTNKTAFYLLKYPSSTFVVASIVQVKQLTPEANFTAEKWCKLCGFAESFSCLMLFFWLQIRFFFVLWLPGRPVVANCQTVCDVTDDKREMWAVRKEQKRCTMEKGRGRNKNAFCWKEYLICIFLKSNRLKNRNEM